ncbi:sensor histidine kinase [Parasporobacterium paucivorans]|uniref:histidine kinase n=1 Tax=Parasporobacterium paucivorans DSM 15970 TaxID=1122934 RepID=A0A1M6HK51_9FIRM|nr:ATP-binding protein [Parasporobacterium paucivorans]SHJ22548.1 Signal transduction histidine kinase [Parasporobacterium paucivorans DSM 15970]
MNESKRMSSTARKLNLSWTGKLFFIFLSLDVILLVMAAAGWCYNIEVSGFGGFFLNAHRSIRTSVNSDILYIVSIDGGESIQTDASVFLWTLMNTAVILGVIQLLILSDSFLSGTRRIRRKLKPLQDIAQKAEVLSSAVFDENKFHHLEETISNLIPEETDVKIQTGDKDLQGIEIALNNLLDRMRDSYRQQARFVSDASHELRTPIAVIKGYVDMLDRWGKQDATVMEESIQALKQESEHMNKLVEQLLFLARGDSGRNKMTFKTFPLSDMIKEVYEESVMIDPVHKYEFAESEVIMVYGDFEMLKQTARILIDNAVKYTKENDTISIRTGINQRKEPYFYVQDNGIGMCEADVTHMFERFYRADSARSNYRGGTGLGLSIAKWIVDRHKGYFEILSRKDIGTRISVVLNSSPQ